jgi:hypothetical protein
MCKLSVQKEKRGMLVLAFSLILVFLAGMNNPCFADVVGIWDDDTSNWITNFAGGDPIDAATGNPAYDPQIAVDLRGRVYITYYQSSRIYLSRYDRLSAFSQDVKIWYNNASGGWTDTFSNGDPIDAATSYNASSPQIAVDSNGVVYVVYEQNYGGADRIYLSRYDGNMRVWDNDGWLAVDTPGNGDPIDATSNNAFFPQIAVDSSGKAYVTYHQSDGQNTHIYLNRYDDINGVEIWDTDILPIGGWTSDFGDGDPIDTTTGNPADLPQIAVDSSGRVYVVYRQFDGSKYRIYLNRYDDTNGVRIWGNGGWTTTLTEGVPIDPGTQDCGGPQLAVDLNNNVYITYAHEGGVDSVYLNRYDGDKVEIWDNLKEWTDTFANGDSIDPGDGYALLPQIAVDYSGRVYVVYMYRQGGVQSRKGLDWRIYLNQCDGDDVKIWSSGGWTNTFSNGDPIDPGTDSCGPPQLAIDLNDNVFITYSHEELSSTYLNRYDGEDVRIWDNNTADWVSNFAKGDSIDPGGDGYASSPQIAVDDLSGRVYVTYMHGQFPQQSRIGIYYRIYLDRYVPLVTEAEEDDEDDEDDQCCLEAIFFETSMADDGVMFCRQFRDNKLLPSPVGRLFVSTYYKTSPYLVELIRDYPILKNVAREILKPVIWLL